MPQKTILLALLAGVIVLLTPDQALAATNLLEEGYLWAYLSLFGAGFLVSLTPCVYPMIPIILGVFGARDEDVSRRKAFLLASAYILGMCTLYTALGVGFGLAGQESDFGTFLANPWVVVPLVAFYLALAASMFGFFTFDLPQALKNRLHRVGGRGYGGAFGMGLIGGLTAAPCTGPALLSILVFISTTGSGLLGGSLLFVHALGMGVLFWVLAISAVNLPKSGPWMDGIKSLSGVLIAVVAAYFLSYIVPGLRTALPGTAFLVGALALTAAGILLGAITKSFFHGGFEAARKGLGIAFMVAGLLGTWNWFLTPELKLSWRHSEHAAFTDAKAQNKGVMIDFSANWCIPCQELEAQTFADEAVYRRIAENYIPLKFDVTHDTKADEKLKEKYKADTLPTVIFLDAEGMELARLRGTFMPPKEFLQLLKSAKRSQKGTKISPSAHAN